MVENLPGGQDTWSWTPGSAHMTLVVPQHCCLVHRLLCPGSAGDRSHPGKGRGLGPGPGGVDSEFTNLQGALADSFQSQAT